MSTWKNYPESIENYFGFVYFIRNNITKKYYVGKKQFLKKTRLKKNKTRKRDKIVWKDNDVEEYWGSSKDLLQDIEEYGKDNFTRIIIEFCTSKWHMTYAELKWQLEFNVLCDPLAYNGIINCRLRSFPKNYVDIERKKSQVLKLLED